MLNEFLKSYFKTLRKTIMKQAIRTKLWWTVSEPS